MAEQESNVTLRMTREQAEKFFRGIAEDDDFRKRLEANPGEVLAESGIEISPPEAIPHAVTLPTKDEVRQLLGRLAAGEPPFGRVPQESWKYALFAVLWSFPALPYIAPSGPGDGPR